MLQKRGNRRTFFYGLLDNIALLNSKPVSEFVSALALLQPGNFLPEFSIFSPELTVFCGKLPAFGVRLLQFPFQLCTTCANGLWRGFRG